MNLVRRYLDWLHLRWPAGRVEKLPACEADGRTAMAGVTIVGDLTGVPLLKFALDSGAAAARRVVDELRSKARPSASSGEVLDVVVLGGGVAGISAAIELGRAGVRCRVVEATRAFATIATFPAGKPIFTYPTEMIPRSALTVSAASKEALLEELEAQRARFGVPITTGTATQVRRVGDHIAVSLDDGTELWAVHVIVAIGRSGNHRRLGVEGEHLPHVVHRVIDPGAHSGQRILIVGGGDSAVEAAIAMADVGSKVTLVHRGSDFSRARPENSERLRARAESGQLDLRLNARVLRFTEAGAVLASVSGTAVSIDVDAAFVLIGKDAPLDFFRRSGLPIRGERGPKDWAPILAFAALATVVYAMKAFGVFGDAGWNPSVLAKQHLSTLSEASSALWSTLVASASNGIGFFISLLYCTAVVLFGVARIRRRRTPYVTRQTLVLMAIQCVLLFGVPEILLPWLGRLGAFDNGLWKAVADSLFPLADYDANGREYWRAYGFILAWPLFVWNVFTNEPHVAWLVISVIQTFVVIPLIVWRWGKGAYCGWICSCGALAETMGDTLRDRMPHGPESNRLNGLGQLILWVAFGMLILRVVTWFTGSTIGESVSNQLLTHGWKPVVDFALAGALGTGLYFGFSGRLWCRFACPLAALMHIYGRFSQFRIVADGKKCISCNACTTTCHQGIDVMGFASRGNAMADPQCVRCSACIGACPTGVLAFGRVNRQGDLVSLDRLVASPVRHAELGSGNCATASQSEEDPGAHVR